MQQTGGAGPYGYPPPGPYGAFPPPHQSPPPPAARTTSPASVSSKVGTREHGRPTTDLTGKLIRGPPLPA